MEIKIKTTITITAEQIASLLASAFEGGSNYWYRIDEFDEPFEPMAFRTDANQVFRHIDYPMNSGGKLVISCLEDGEINGKTSWVLDQKALIKGMRTMAKKYPDSFRAVVDDSADANTADLYLQCCLFGSVELG